MVEVNPLLDKVKRMDAIAFDLLQQVMVLRSEKMSLNKA